MWKLYFCNDQFTLLDCCYYRICWSRCLSLMFSGVLANLQENSYFNLQSYTLRLISRQYPISPSQQTEPRLDKQDSGSKEHQESGDVEILHNQLGDLFEMLKPTLLNLCEALLLEDNVKKLAEQFLEYLVKNYQVTREPETTLRAFLLSVCWTAAEELKNKIDHKKLLTIARERLGFNCSERDTEKIISRLKPIMDNFICLRTKNPDSEGNFIEPPLGNLKNITLELEEHMKKVEMKCGRQMEKLKNKHYEEFEKFENPGRS